MQSKLVKYNFYDIFKVVKNHCTHPPALPSPAHQFPAGF